MGGWEECQQRSWIIQLRALTQPAECLEHVITIINIKLLAEILPGFPKCCQGPRIHPRFQEAFDAWLFRLRIFFTRIFPIPGAAGTQDPRRYCILAVWRIQFDCPRKFLTLGFSSSPNILDPDFSDPGAAGTPNPRKHRILAAWRTQFDGPRKFLTLVFFVPEYS